MQNPATSASTIRPDDPARLEALYATGLLDSPPEEAFDRLTRLTGRLLHTEVSLVTLVDRDRLFFKSSRGLPEPIRSAREMPLSPAFCKHVVLTGNPVAIEDARAHPEMCDTPAVRDLGVQAYLGVPLRTPDGYVIGSLCAIDNTPRTWTDEDERLITDLAALAMTEIELRLQLRQSRRTEKALREREERYHLVARATNDVIWDWNLRTDHITWNEAIDTLFGYTDAAEAGSTASWWQDQIHPDDRSGVIESLHHVIRGNDDHWTGEYRFRRADGTYAYVLDRGYLLRDVEGTPLRMIGALLDLTDHLQAEAALRQSEGRFRSLVEATAAIVWTTPPSGEFEDDQPGWSVFTGQRFEDLKGWGWLDAVHPDDRAHTAHVWRNAVTSKTLYQVEHRLRRYDGVYRHMLVRALPIIENGVLHEWIGIHSDITGTKKTEKALRLQTHVLETVNQVNATLAAELDLGKLVQAVTDAGTKLTGAQYGAFFYNVIDEDGEHYTLYTLSGASRSDFPDLSMPRNTEVFHAAFRAKGIVRSDDITQDERYGKNSPLRGMPEGHPPVRSYLAAPVVSRSGAVLGGLFFGHDERGVFTERSEQIIASMTDQAAIAIENARLYQTAQIELAERRRAEKRLKELNETLEQRVAERTAELERTNVALTHRNRELQEFAYVASHDLQEPLRKIRSFGDLLATDYGDLLDEQGAFYLERMHNAAGRMSTLISDLLSFSRVMTQGSPFIEIDLNQVIDGVLQDLHVLLDEQEGRVEVAPLPKIAADPTQMRQLFQNLISNALKFRRPDAPPVVRITASTDAGPPPTCRIAVRDNGIGFEQQYADKIFMPFQRLHGRSTYEGTGIGLAICRRIIERHHGTIHAESTHGQGSTFIIDLPMRQQ